MEKIFEKLEAYNLFNYLLPGMIYSILLKYYVNIDICNENIVVTFLIYYFVGLIISRIASIIVQPLLKKIKIINMASYKEYISASKIDSKIDILSSDNNTYRNIVTTFLLVLLSKGLYLLKQNFSISGQNFLTIMLVVLIIIMIFAYRKQTNTIKERVEVINSKNSDLN